MASHRRVKTVDYNDYEDDNDDYDDTETNQTYSENDKEQLRNGAVSVREALGPDFNPSNTEIEEALWHYYYDVPQSVAYLKKKYTPRQKKVKQITKFDQAASVAASKIDQKQNAEQLQAFGSGTPDPYPMRTSVTPSVLFKDVPWLNVPAQRLGQLVCASRHPKVGLPGGSSPAGGKPSKLAQLAAARKKAAEERQNLSKIKPEINPAVSNVFVSPAAPQDQSSSKWQDSGRTVPIRVAEEAENKKVKAFSQSDKDQAQNNPVLQDAKWSAQQAPISSLPMPVYYEKSQSEDLKSDPSTFATTMTGKRLSTSFACGSLNLQTLSFPFAVQGNHSNFDAFAVPSPDDIVLDAQSKGAKSIKDIDVKDVDVKASSQRAMKDIANGVSAIKVEEPISRAKSRNLNVVAEFEKSNAKNAANFVVIGHVDHGKSTLMGRLLYDLEVVDQRSVTKLRRQADAMKKSSFALAWVMDSTSEERQRGVTVDIAMNHFETAKTKFTILDAPGHQDFIPNMIAGASQADFAVLVIDAGTNAFESGLRGQTKEHAMLARSLGIGRIIVAVNKMDTISWAEERFCTIKEQMSAFFMKQGFLSKNISFVPCAGLTGQNVVRPPVEGTMPWYTNGTLVDELDRSEPTKRAISQPLRLTVSNIFRDSVQNPLSISGRIESGSLQIGDMILAMPANEKAAVKGIDVENNSRDWAVAGQIATLHLTDIDPIYLRLGDIICSPTNKPIKNTNSFIAKILAFDHVTPMYLDVYKGRMQAPARIAALLAILEKQSGEMTKKKPRIIKPGDVARVRVDLEGLALPLEAPARVVFRTSGNTIAAGLIESVQ